MTVIFNSGSDIAAQAAGGNIDVGETSIGSPMPLILARETPHAWHCIAGAAPGDLAKCPNLREQGLDVVTANSYTVLLPNGLKPEQIAFWARRDE